MLKFSITSRDLASNARTGILELPHGTIETPRFMPVGTNGTVKAIDQTTLEEIGFKLILSNTYHLFLRPGLEVIGRAGGLHRFMGWNGNILTDSGGFQVFSLAPFNKIGRDGVTFRSHLDGSLHHFTPERVVEIQSILGSDIMMTLDVCTPPDIDYAKALEALEITTDWARRSRDRLRSLAPAAQGSLFGIIQGNFYHDLRRRSAEEILELDLPGTAIGGLSVGEPEETFQEFLSLTAALLPKNKPRYLMGVGTPEYIFAAIESGIDLFDCVFPTRIARNAAAFTSRGMISLRNERHATSFIPIDERCGCRVCSRYTRAYLRHLFKTKEILAAMLATEHNLYFMHRLVNDIGDAVKAGRFLELKKSFLEEYGRPEEEER